MTKPLETSRLILRRLKLNDAHALFQVVGDPKVMEFWAPGPDQIIEQTLNRITAINEHWNVHGFGDWAVIEKKHNQLIGFCGLHYITDHAEVNIGYALDQSKWRLGFGSELVHFILEFGFKYLRLREIVAVIDPQNAASLKLIQKHGLHYWKMSSYLERPRVVYKLAAESFLSSNEAQ